MGAIRQATLALYKRYKSNYTDGDPGDRNSILHMNATCGLTQRVAISRPYILDLK